MGLELEDEVLAGPVPLKEIKINIFLLTPALHELCRIGSQSVYANEGAWRRVVPLHQPRCLIRAMTRLPTIIKPVRMRQTQGGMLSDQVGQKLLCGFLFPEVSTEDRVHKTRLGAASKLFGKFHGFMDCGVIWNPIKPEELVEPQSQQRRQRRLLSSGLGLAGDQPIQCPLPADGPVRQFQNQASILGPGRRSAERGSHDIFDIFPAIRMFDERADGNFSWFLMRH